MKKTWIWMQPSGYKWNVETDSEKGTVTVIDQNNKVVLEQKGMDEQSVKVIEDNFMSIVAQEIKDGKIIEIDNGLIHHDEPRVMKTDSANHKKIYDDMMYA